jgi:hypothetical protein
VDGGTLRTSAHPSSQAVALQPTSPRPICLVAERPVVPASELLWLRRHCCRANGCHANACFALCFFRGMPDGAPAATFLHATPTRTPHFVARGRPAWLLLLLWSLVSTSVSRCTGIECPTGGQYWDVRAVCCRDCPPSPCARGELSTNTECVGLPHADLTGAGHFGPAHFLILPKGMWPRGNMTKI